jgi:hypothetical protein
LWNAFRMTFSKSDIQPHRIRSEFPDTPFFEVTHGSQGSSLGHEARRCMTGHLVSCVFASQSAIRVHSHRQLCARMCLGWWMHATSGSIITIMAPGRTETTVDPDSSHLLRGTVEIESAAVLYIDVRAQPALAALGEIDRFVQEIEHLASAGTPSLCGLAIAAPQPSDTLAL